MLDLSAFSTTVSQREAVISGQSIAKSARHKSQRQKAHEAARWVTGGVLLAPTTKLAATAFQVSVALVSQEIAKLPPAPPLIDRLWGSMSPSERNDFVGRNLDSVWRALERATS